MGLNLPRNNLADPSQTTVLHILFNKPTLLAVYLQDDSDPASAEPQTVQLRKRLWQIFFSFGFIVPLSSLVTGEVRKDATYMSLISVWASPVLFLLWSLSYQLLITLPRTNVLLPIALPTLYLWFVDTVALRRGTWSISSGTKLGVEIWRGLEIEEAVFFLVTNTLVVFGSVAFDHAITVLDTFPELFPKRLPGTLPSPKLMIEALLTPTSSYSPERLTGLRNALKILSQKSRSFYLASGVFTGRLRIDLILLYAFCRVGDDLVDTATTPADAEKWIKNLSNFLKTIYNEKSTSSQIEKTLSPFNAEARSVLSLLPKDKLPSGPLFSLLDGFRIDVAFLSGTQNAQQPSPIQTTADLETYASRVAGTVAELCLNLVYAYDPDQDPKTNSSPSALQTRERCVTAGKRMGQALQYINVARDVTVDAAQDRCYIPAEWFVDPATTSATINFKQEILRHRRRILAMAEALYAENVGAIESLPLYARTGIRVAVESYVEIGRELRRRLEQGQDLDRGPRGRATVPRWRRMWIAWWTAAGWRGST